MTYEDVDFTALMFFFTVLGSRLPQVLRTGNIQELVSRDPRARIWFEKAVALGVVRVEDDEIIVDWNALVELREKVRKVLEKCLKSLP